MEIKGTFSPPPFTEDDLLEIERRIVDIKPPYKEDLVSLARYIRTAETIDESSWEEIRQRARHLSEKEKQLQTDLFRLLKEVNHG
jgi:hypothetical protein